jgi:hypothetical protein
MGIVLGIDWKRWWCFGLLEHDNKWWWKSSSLRRNNRSWLPELFNVPERVKRETNEWLELEKPDCNFLWIASGWILRFIVKELLWCAMHESALPFLFSNEKIMQFLLQHHQLQQFIQHVLYKRSKTSMFVIGFNCITDPNFTPLFWLEYFSIMSSNS